MKKKQILHHTAVLITFAVAAVFLWSDFGLDMTPLTKMFIVFVGLILGWQSIPAVLVLVKIAKGIHADQEHALSELFVQQRRKP
ncbi:MAG: hypothetical protein C0622_02565 [Desulfuromonas sp.]|nr:MAG: hypothetical protein C0622_02565 [Desulfuromonas sp.]